MATDDGPLMCFNVMYSRPSTRKHKKWEGDGVVVCYGRTESVLYSETGKEVTRSLLTSKRISEIYEGEEFHFGSMEIQIQDRREDVPRYIQTNALPSSSVSVHSPLMNTPSPSPVVRPFVSLKRPANNTFEENAATKKSFPSSPLPLPKPLKPFVNPLNTSMQPQCPPWIIDPIESSICPGSEAVVDPSIARHLRDHQKEGITFIYQRLRDCPGGVILADEMGLGKSVQTIASCWALMRKKASRKEDVVRKCLLLVPSSLVNNWKSEFRKWFRIGRFPASCVKKPGDIQSFRSSFTCSPFLICSYDLALRHISSLRDVRFDLIVCDEAHRLKNLDGKLRKALVSLSIPRRLLLTGTPLQNDFDEFFSLLDFVRPNSFGTLPQFRAEVALENNLSLNDRIANCMLRRTSEVNNSHLPVKNEYVIFCAPSAIQKASMRAITGHMTGDPLVLIDYLRKLSNHPSLLYQKLIHQRDTQPSFQYSSLLSVFPEEYRTRVEHSGKLSVLADLLPAFNRLGESTVIFSNYTKTLDMLSSLCNSLGFTVFRVDGQTTVTDRQKLVDSFNEQSSSSNVFLLSTKAGGVGLNLIGASRLILFDSDWNPAGDLQAMARIWRDGQKRECHIYRLVTTGTIDEKILQRQVKKTGLGSVLDVNTIGEDGNNVKFRDEDIMDIFTISEGECNTHDIMECECDGRGLLPVELEEEREEEEVDDDIENEDLDENSEPFEKRECVQEEEADEREEGESVEDEEEERKQASMASLFLWRHYSTRHSSSWDYFLSQNGLNPNDSSFSDITFAMHLSTKF